MFLRVILLFLLFAGGCWGFISIAPRITGKQWVMTGKVIGKAAVCAIFAATLLATIAILQHASN
jgi:hypothetical protein